MAKNADVKRQKILEAARRRFAHFGMAKTTMAEIAQDLSFSKALLYYYFPDKNRLYAAVLEYTVDEMVAETERRILKTTTIDGALNAFLEARLDVIKENYSIFEYTYSLRNDFPPDLEEACGSIIDKDVEQVQKIFKFGIDKGEIMVDDLPVTAKIFMISVLGMRMGVVKEFKNIFIPPTKEEFDYILTLQKKLSAIFIRGLRP
ncbi:TetR family transcriptional regulator [Sphingobacterium sp. DK4209]|uniref:TetR family transcriptional regulator n=1 Tax=Sphingobacterium zhuxiongii TaxID=2662364 RepID=A0A5Q0QER1_9SPHI|nr:MULTISPECIES: TetR/AcrR family transcriptional regulator [unclassified Sphingobacterium]MVZ64311.1 TetR family transcriptional regulator [Sphingobacterium sp. DK4209]QGA25660.1 TetR family transcriptional regulator [Sphingobacterium sp. dk4302]